MRDSEVMREGRRSELGGAWRGRDECAESERPEAKATKAAAAAAEVTLEAAAEAAAETEVEAAVPPPLISDASLPTQAAEGNRDRSLYGRSSL